MERKEACENRRLLLSRRLLATGKGTMCGHIGSFEASPVGRLLPYTVEPRTPAPASVFYHSTRRSRESKYIRYRSNSANV